MCNEESYILPATTWDPWKTFAFFFFRTEQTWTNMFRQHGNDIHPRLDWSASLCNRILIDTRMFAERIRVSYRPVETWQRSSRIFFPFGARHGGIPPNDLSASIISTIWMQKKKESILGSQNKMEPIYSGRQLREKVTSFQCNFIHNNNNWVFSLNNHN